MTFAELARIYWDQGGIGEGTVLLHFRYLDPLTGPMRFVDVCVAMGRCRNAYEAVTVAESLLPRILVPR